MAHITTFSRVTFGHFLVHTFRFLLHTFFVISILYQGFTLLKKGHSAIGTRTFFLNHLQEEREILFFFLVFIFGYTFEFDVHRSPIQHRKNMHSFFLLITFAHCSNDAQGGYVS